MWGIQTHGYTNPGTAHRHAHTSSRTPHSEGAVVRLCGVSPHSCPYPALQQSSAKWALAYANKPHLTPHAPQQKYQCLITLAIDAALVDLNRKADNWITCVNKPFYSHHPITKSVRSGIKWVLVDLQLKLTWILKMTLFTLTMHITSLVAHSRHLN